MGDPLMTIKELRQSTGLSQAAFSERFEIPRRTIEDWEAGRRNPPPYVPRLIEKLIEKEQR